jgi:putative iron-dependent peroxidase
VTGSLFFVPTATFLENVAADAAAPPIAAPTPKESEATGETQPRPSPRDGSLGIGSLKKEAGHE